MRRTILAAVLSPALAGAALANAACPPGLPPGITCAGKDLAQAQSGTYAVDPSHAAVIARVSHLGYSYSIFRFDKVAGTLIWDPAAPTRSKLAVQVETASVATNVAGFAAQIAGDGFLNSNVFPQRASCPRPSDGATPPTARSAASSP